MNREIPVRDRHGVLTGDTIYLEDILAALEELRAELRRSVGEAFREESLRPDPMEHHPVDGGGATS